MVRIIIHGGRNKGAMASLLVAVVAAASVWAGYWVWHHDDTIVPQRRGIEDDIVRWRCPNGHVFEDYGARGAVLCPTCRQPARILIAYECPKHHTVDLLVMFDEATGKPANVRFKDGKWVSVSTVIPCPHCGRDMHPKRRSPFEKTGTAAKPKAGGPPANPPP